MSVSFHLPLSDRLRDEIVVHAAQIPTTELNSQRTRMCSAFGEKVRSVAVKTQPSLESYRPTQH